MRKLKTLFAAFALVIAVPVVAAPDAAAQTTVIVVDNAKVLRDSRAGKDIQAKITSIENQMKAELEPTAKSLESQGKSIQAKTANMTPEAMRADASLRAEAESYQQKLVDLSNQRNQRAAELALTERSAYSAFYEALKPVLDEVMRERNAQILLNASDVVVAAPTVDVTATVIQKLDSRTPTITVTRQRVPQQTAQQ